MKKLIIAAAIVCAAVVSQAAAVGWTCAGATDYKNGDYGIFIIGLNGVESVAQIQALVAAGGLDAVSSYEFASGTVNSSGAASKASTTSGMSITYKEPPATAAENTYQAFIIVENVAGDQASVTALASQTLTNNSTAKTFGFANQSANFASNEFAVAPEPTSGLLLLLGVGLMALKRKRA